VSIRGDDADVEFQACLAEEGAFFAGGRKPWKKIGIPVGLDQSAATKKDEDL
jgi:hypothetical protein